MKLSEIEGAVASAQNEVSQQSVNLNEFIILRDSGEDSIQCIANNITVQVPLDLFIKMQEELLVECITKAETLEKILQETQAALDSALGAIGSKE